MTHNAIIQQLYEKKPISAEVAADIAEELDTETAQVTLRINRMIERLGTVLIEQGELF